MNPGAAALARVLIVGPTPPPYHGVATFIRDFLGAPQSHFLLEHLDTSDRRDASNLGRWDAGNLTLGFSNLSEQASRVLRRRYALVYVPISQNIPAFLRDALFILQARLLGARVVVQLHGGYFRQFYDRAPAWFRAFIRFTLRRCARVVVLNESFRGIFIDIVPAERIAVVENGVPDFVPALTPPPNRSETILFMSSLARSKGILRLIEAFVLLRASRPGARLHVAGSWTEPDTEIEARALAERQRLGDSVCFFGNVDGAAKRAFFESGALFCLPTVYPYEGQPLVLLEALAAALPVVSTRHAAIARTIDEAVTGRLLATDCSAKELARVLGQMLADPGALARMSAAARQAYEGRYTLAACHRNLCAVFDDALRVSEGGQCSPRFR